MTKKMLPVAPLMIEHRLIERMIALMARELRRIEREGVIDPAFIERAVDFIRVYADRCHHGKEEDILFRELAKRDLPEELRRIKDELVAEHRWGREATARLVEGRRLYLAGEREEGLKVVLESLGALVDFYPRHIEKEDRRFFLPVMRLFNQEEKDAMLEECREFDRGLIHALFGEVVSAAERAETEESGSR